MREIVCEACGTRHPESDQELEDRPRGDRPWGTIVVKVWLDCAVDENVCRRDVKIVKDTCFAKRACVEKAITSATQEALKSAIGKLVTE